jgi:hypothetical protein
MLRLTATRKTRNAASRAALLGLLLGALPPGPTCLAEGYPTKPIHLKYRAME